MTDQQKQEILKANAKTMAGNFRLSIQQEEQLYLLLDYIYDTGYDHGWRDHDTELPF